MNANIAVESMLSPDDEIPSKEEILAVAETDGATGDFSNTLVLT
ncbi:MAG: hypothetical protein ACLFWL_09095 [Candidatus Brocadiia bacterium]